MLEVKGLSRHYGETQALDGVSLAFAPGAIHAVLGENGSGKSTLVKILSGVVSPSAGSVEVAGEKVGLFRPAALQALGIATVFQEVLLAPDRSVTDNILLGLDGIWRRRIARSERRNTALASLARISDTSLDPDMTAGRLPLELQQLVVLARALVRKPRILILDEATAALDFADRERIFGVFTEFAAAGGLILFISHRMDEVMRLADRVTILRNGRLVETLERDRINPDLMLRLMAPAAAAGLAHVH
jgi:ribose transport system ATP-binding protein